MCPLTVSEIDRLLLEDAPAGDLTTDALGIGAISGRIIFRARDAMTVAGIDIATAMLQRVGVAVDQFVGSGSAVGAGDILLEGIAPAGAIHLGWKPAQTLVEVMSGIATAAQAVVAAANAVNPAVRVACTRKAYPGGRRLAQLAVKAGGAILHRAGLSETILLFPEHRTFLPDATLAELRDRLRQAAPEKKIVIEVTSPDEARAAMAAGFDVLQLEKFTPDQVREVAAAARDMPLPPLIAVAGGINPCNAGDYVIAGAELLVTSWPYTAPPRDVKVVIASLDS